MAEVGQREQRAEGREQRRARADKPTGKAENASSQAEGGAGVGPQLQRAIMTAAAAAVAGGLAGAAKAMVDRRAQRPVPADEPESDDRPEAHEERPEPDADAATPETTTQESEEHEEEEDERQGTDDSETTGAESGEVAEIISRARREVEQVLGHDAEGVSGIERSNGRWCVTVEVVELRRVPESTDVLASYAVVLDRDGDLVSLERTRRYRRSQVEEGR
jgi:Gas vesicle synthesis protein GvpO